MNTILQQLVRPVDPGDPGWSICENKKVLEVSTSFTLFEKLSLNKSTSVVSVCKPTINVMELTRAYCYVWIACHKSYYLDELTMPFFAPEKKK